MSRFVTISRVLVVFHLLVAREEHLRGGELGLVRPQAGGVDILEGGGAQFLLAQVEDAPANDADRGAVPANLAGS